jgi:Pyruvate/2-oxoglutarate dehydrogenase complex, dihydrolipoamide acyltransferase (E2) component, and related enzymes
MAKIFNLPDVGEGMAEGEIATWLVKEGEQVAEGQPILEVQNDKLLQEILSPFAGIVTKIFVEAGTISRVGDALIEFDGAKANDINIETTETKVIETQHPPKLEVDPSNDTIVNILAMPSIRRYAQENSIDITTVKGTGKKGHITKSDIDAVINNNETSQKQLIMNEPIENTPVQTTIITDTSNITRIKMTPTRRAIAQAMVNSKTQIPHVTIFDEIEVSKLIEHRQQFKEYALENGIKLTYLAYITKALVTVIRKYPFLNASIDSTTQEIIQKNYYNIGVAVDTPTGLFVPNIKNAETKSILVIAQEIAQLAKAAQAGQLTAPMMKDGTITISNIGSANGLWFTPIINFPEVAILGVGRINKEPIINEMGEITIGQMLKLSLSFDHRLIDGMLAQSALNELKRLLNKPEYLLMEG